MSDREHVDLAKFIRDTVRVTNESGGRAYESGVRTFDCPLCGDRSARGWVGLTRWGAGCFNLGCAASPQLDGGVVEWARRVLGLRTRGDAWRWLVERYGTDTPAPAPLPVKRSSEDFCRFPGEMRAFGTDSPLEPEFRDFVARQWGVDAGEWGLGWCASGYYAWRVVVPVVMDGQPVGFQARTVRGAGVKYLTSRHDGPEPECARPASAMLFGYDWLREGAGALVVEGAGDAMAWQSRRGRRSHALDAVALLGTALTAEKAALLAARRPDRVVVALDDEPAAQRRALAHVETLRGVLEPGTDLAIGKWVGAKDAGAGADLEVSRGSGIGSDVRARLLGR